MATKFAVGDKVIFVDRELDCGQPKVTDVERATPAGAQFSVRGSEVRFRQPKYEEYAEAKFGTYSYSTVQVYPYSPRTLKELQRKADERMRDEKEKDELERRERAARGARHLANITHVKTVISIQEFTKHDAPNGDRIYSAFVPVNPRFAERKTYDYLVIVCRDRERHDWSSWDASEAIKANCVGFHGGSCGGRLTGTYRAASDEEAVFEAVESAYFSW